MRGCGTTQGPNAGRSPLLPLPHFLFNCNGHVEGEAFDERVELWINAVGVINGV